MNHSGKYVLVFCNGFPCASLSLCNAAADKPLRIVDVAHQGLAVDLLSVFAGTSLAILSWSAITDGPGHGASR
jgi:hypothetical protein